MLIQRAETLTRGNTGLRLTIAANYGGRWDVTQACRRIIRDVTAGKLNAEDVNEDTIARCLATAYLPEPDLFIRTGGEQRVSNFLLWQLAYTELYFTETLWPAFDRDEFEHALASFAKRERRFGKTGDQIVKQRQIRNA
jgi:undecaprenyl diphosphate synthase